MQNAECFLASFAVIYRQQTDPKEAFIRLKICINGLFSQHYVFQLIVFQPSQIAAVLEFVLEIPLRNVRVRQASWKPL
jgi:hypothetical protein